MTHLIKDLPILEKPREKLKKLGASNLSDEELIAIILRCGAKNISVKDLAISLSKKIGGLNNYNSLSINSLKQIKGIGEVKAITLLAAIELGRRTITNTQKRKVVLNNPIIIFNYFKYDFLNETQEHLIAVFLDTKKQVITRKEIFKGTTNMIVTHPREIFKEAIKYSAVSIILIHNHPSGNPKPSSEDIKFTKNIINTGHIIGIPLIDHIIIGNNNYYSFYENGEI